MALPGGESFDRWVHSPWGNRRGSDESCLWPGWVRL